MGKEEVFRDANETIHLHMAADGVEAMAQLQVNCYLSKPTERDAFATLVKSVIDSWSTKVKLPQQRTTDDQSSV